MDETDVMDIRQETVYVILWENVRERERERERERIWKT
jgi:hypothetical protein